MRVGVGAARRSKACKGEGFFCIHLVKFHFVLLFHLQISNRLNQNFKKKENYHSFAAYLKGPFFFINKGGTKKKMQGSK